jgi:hypothetical protein
MNKKCKLKGKHIPLKIMVDPTCTTTTTRKSGRKITYSPSQSVFLETSLH